METYSSSSSSSFYLSQYARQEKGTTKVPVPQSSYHSSLHAIRKPQVKPWKKPIAPLPPTPPKVYKVDPVNFKDLVQKLTSAPPPPDSSSTQLQSQPRLQSVAPPPLNLVRRPTTSLFGRDIAPPAAAAAPVQFLDSSPVKAPFSALYREMMAETPDHAKYNRISDCGMESSSLELNLLSPSPRNWCSYPLLRPGTLSSLEQSTVL